jgi:hypothetical protein
MSSNPEGQSNRIRHPIWLGFSCLTLTGSVGVATVAVNRVEQVTAAEPGMVAGAQSAQLKACRTDPAECGIFVPIAQTIKKPVVKERINLSEHMSGSASVLTFGEGDVVVDGTGHEDYHASMLHKLASLSFHPVQGTIFLEARPATFNFRPCIEVASNYKDIGIAGTKDNSDGDTTGNSGQLAISGDRSASGMLHVTVQAGVLEACDMSMPNTNANKAIYEYPHNFNDDMTYAFQTAAQELLTDNAELDAAQAQSCGGGINMASADEAVRLVTLGYMASTPGWKDFTSIPIDRITVDFTPASDGYEQALAAKLAHDEATIANQTIIPDPKGHNLTVPKGTIDFNPESFGLVSCGPADMHASNN